MFDQTDAQSGKTTPSAVGPVLPVAVVWGLALATAVSIASMLAFNWFFLPPTHTFQLRDGAKVPLSIVYKKGFKRDGKGPLFLYGYGSYGFGTPAMFSSSRLVLLDRGMAYAISHIRGGDEMGGHSGREQIDRTRK